MDKLLRIIVLFLFCSAIILFTSKKILAQTVPNCSIVGPSKVQIGEPFDVRWLNSKDLMGIEAFWIDPQNNLEPSAEYLSDKIPACPPQNDICIWKGLVMKNQGTANVTIRVKNSQGIGFCSHSISADEAITKVPTKPVVTAIQKLNENASKCELLDISKSKIKVGDKVKFTAVGSSQIEDKEIETMEFTVYKGELSVYYEVVRARRVLNTNKYTATTQDFSPTEVGEDYRIEARMITN